MGLLSLRLAEFRNIADARVETDGRDVFLIGNNGQGKTNFLEAVYMLCFGGSFRTRNDRDMIRNGADGASLWGRLAVGDDQRGVGVSLQAAAGKRIAVDGKPLRDRASLISFAPAIAFTHEDLRIIDGDPERRRTFFDQTLSLFDPLYIDLLRRYRRALRARNTLLRVGDARHLDVYDPQLAACGFELQERRAACCTEFALVFADLCARIGGIEAATIVYRPSWREVTAVEQARTLLDRQRERDLQLRTTTTGPHRDDFLLLLDGARFAAYGSTGQKRLASLVLRVAQAEFFHRMTRRLPLLLLDDVLLELDAGKREQFLQHLPAHEQAFFTFLPDEPYQRYRAATTLLLEVTAGRFTQCTAPASC